MEDIEAGSGIGVIGLCVCTSSCTLRVPSARAERPAVVSA